MNNIVGHVNTEYHIRQRPNAWLNALVYLERFGRRQKSPAVCIELLNLGKRYTLKGPNSIDEFSLDLVFTAFKRYCGQIDPCVTCQLSDGLRECCLVGAVRPTIKDRALALEIVRLSASNPETSKVRRSLAK